MADVPTRSTADVAGAHLDSMDRMLGQLLHRLDGLTTDEYLWEPVDGMWSVRVDGGGDPTIDGAGQRSVEPAPLTTIAWRLWHIAIDCFDDYTRRFAGDGSDASPTWTLDPGEAVAQVRTTWARYRDVVESRGWWEPLGDDWGPWAEAATADMALHASNELVHHAAEVALLRDLYRAAFTGADV